MNTNRRNNASPEKTPTREPRGRSLGPSITARKGKHISQTRRNISDKIEALYRAKSLERRAENVKMSEAPIKPLAFNKIDNRRENRKSIAKTDSGRNFSGTTSKVAEMKRMFDERLQAQAAAGQQRSKSPVTNFSRKLNVDRRSFDTSQAPPPPPMPEFSSKRTSGVSPKTVVEPVPIPEPDPRKDLNHIAHAPVSAPAEGRPRARSKVIDDRVKQFEDINQKIDATNSRKKERSFSGMIGNSLISMRKSFYELSSWKKYESQEEKRGLSGKDIQSIVNELTDGADDGKIGKRKTIVGRWNAIPQRKAAKTLDENMMTFGSVVGSEVDMVVKEAQCGLKEPKPRRAAEMERMMLLCREREARMRD